MKIHLMAGALTCLALLGACSSSTDPTVIDDPNEALPSQDPTPTRPVIVDSEAVAVQIGDDDLDGYIVFNGNKCEYGLVLTSPEMIEMYSAKLVATNPDGTIGVSVVKTNGVDLNNCYDYFVAALAPVVGPPPPAPPTQGDYDKSLDEIGSLLGMMTESEQKAVCDEWSADPTDFYYSEVVGTYLDPTPTQNDVDELLTDVCG
jgi:hypothetical protein